MTVNKKPLEEKMLKRNYLVTKNRATHLMMSRDEQPIIKNEVTSKDAKEVEELECKVQAYVELMQILVFTKSLECTTWFI